MRSVCLILLLAIGCGGPARLPGEAPRGTPTFTVATYNVNYGMAGDPPTVNAVLGIEADLVVLQETTPQWQAVLEGALEGDPRHRVWLHAPGAGGLAILSRWPVLEHEVLPAPSGWFPAWVLVLASPQGPLQALVVHLRPPLSDSGSVFSGYFSTPAVRVEEITTYLASLDPAHPTLILGDFNENERGAALQLLRRRGFRSVLPEYAPRARTWRWETSLGTLSSRLDHIVYDPRLEPLDAEVRDEGRSDHLPVVATFRWADPG